MEIDPAQLRDLELLTTTDRLFVFDEQRAYDRKSAVPRWLELASAYKSAADVLANELIGKAKVKTSYVYPIVYLYRHAIELEIKSLLLISLVGTEAKEIRQQARRILNTHDFKTLFQELVEHGFLPDGSRLFHIPDRDDSLYDCLIRIAPLLAELAEFDPQSMSFRYPVTKQLEPVNANLHGLSLKNLKEIADKLTRTLCAARRVIESYIDSSLNLDQAEYWGYDNPPEGIDFVGTERELGGTSDAPDF